MKMFLEAETFVIFIQKRKRAAILKGVKLKNALF